MKSRKGIKYTGEVNSARLKRSQARKSHKEAVEDGSFDENLPLPLVPPLFKAIEASYWSCLRSVEDPRKAEQRVYPLDLILHRIISGFIDGTRYIGVLFPRQQRMNQEGLKRQLGALPTRSAVYNLLRRIDWDQANAILAPLWERLGYTPDLVVKRQFRNPKVILEEFREEEKQKAAAQRKQLKLAGEAKERSQGMSAAAAKRTRTPSSQSEAQSMMTSQKQLKADGMEAEVCPASVEPPPTARKQTEACPAPVEASPTTTNQVDLLLDGKVVKASYNMDVKERFVHVTHTQVDPEGNKKRNIVGAKETVLDRNGEWGAALSVLEAFCPLPPKRSILVSGDAGFCVEEFCKWLTVMGFFICFGSNKMPVAFLTALLRGPTFAEKIILKGIILRKSESQAVACIAVVFGD